MAIGMQSNRVTMQFPDGVESITIYGTKVVQRPEGGQIQVSPFDVHVFEGAGLTVVPEQPPE